MGSCRLGVNSDRWFTELLLTVTNGDEPNLGSFAARLAYEIRDLTLLASHGEMCAR